MPVWSASLRRSVVISRPKWVNLPPIRVYRGLCYGIGRKDGHSRRQDGRTSPRTARAACGTRRHRLQHRARRRQGRRGLGRRLHRHHRRRRQQPLRRIQQHREYARLQAGEQARRPGTPLRARALRVPGRPRGRGACRRRRHRAGARLARQDHAPHPHRVRRGHRRRAACLNGRQALDDALQPPHGTRDRLRDARGDGYRFAQRRNRDGRGPRRLGPLRSHRHRA